MEDCAADSNGNPRFFQAALNNICDNALYILSIIISLLLRVRDTVYKRVVQCIELYV